MARFDEKVVLITGAASSIGRASAERIASEGGKVVCVDLQEKAVQGVADGILAAGGEACAVVCDVTDLAAVNATVAATVEKYGKLNALCNIAGILHFDHTHDVPKKASLPLCIRWSPILRWTGSSMRAMVEFCGIMSRRSSSIAFRRVISLQRLIRSHPRCLAVGLGMTGV